MSNLRTIDLKEVDDLVDFVRGRGYVLDFSDPSFSQFFATELAIDINKPDLCRIRRLEGQAPPVSLAEGR